QAIMQLAAVFSLLPFLGAAADMETFRQSRAGGLLLTIIGDGSDRYVIMATGLISLAVLVIGNGVSLAAEYVRANYAQSLGNWLRGRLLELICDRRYEYFQSINSSLLVKNIIDDVTTFVQGTVSPSLDILARGCLTLLLGTALVIVEPVIALSSVLVLGLYFLAIRPIRRGASRISNGILTNTKALYFRVSQMLVGIKPILATDNQLHFIDHCVEASRGLAHHCARIPVYTAIPRIGLEVVVFGGLIVWLLANLAAGEDIVALMPRIGLIAIVAYRLMPSLQLISSQTMIIASTRQAMDEITRIFDEQERFSTRGDSTGVRQARVPADDWHESLQFDNVSFGYAGAESLALKNVCFAISKGEHVAFVGHTGSGKSTMIDLILGLLQPTSGAILIDGKPLDPHTAPGWRRMVGYVPQDVFLHDASIAENIAFGRSPAELAMEQVRRVAGIAHAVDFIEQHDAIGYDAQVGERGVRLSGGQRQRLALARALYETPNVLVLDEATSALDPQTEKSVVATLAATHEKLTVITVTHRLSTIREYDRIYFLDHGVIVASGSYAELQQHPQFKKFSR
ncbi:MAG: ABC transporter ATP-binding protein, partial [Alteraurantiacibacter sp.]